MDILVNVVNQKLKIATNLKSLVAGTQEFVRFTFNLTDDWDGLLTFAQFCQNGVAYNQYLDEENGAFLPSEIETGTCTVMLYGSGDDVIATTNYLTLTIDENILVADANSTEISTSLYNQLVSMVGSMQDEVEVLSGKVTALENNEVVADLIEDAVVSEMAEYLNSGYLANLTIEDGSLTRSKVDTDFEDTLDKADSAMQPSVYDPRGLGVDVYSYAQSKADIVQDDVDGIKSEIRGAYRLNNDVSYQNLGDALRGVITLSESYTRAILADYKAFTISIVDELPIVGDSMTFYLLPNSAGTGYDKYWWITDSVTGVSKWDCFGSATTVVVDELPESGDEEVDYIYHDNGNYLFYKWIDSAWQIVGGSTAYVGNSLPATGNSYTDYYILNPNGVYVHYRWISNAFRPIGSNAYTKSEIDAMFSEVNDDITDIENDVSTNERNISTNASNIASLSNTITNLQQTIANLDVGGVTYYATYGTAEINGTETENVYTLYEVDGAEETIVSQFVIAGGGGGQQSTTTLIVERVTSSPLVVTPNDSVNLVYTYSSEDGDGEQVDGVYTWKLNGTVIASGTCLHGINTFNATDFCSIGTQKFTLTVVDEGGSTVVKTWTIQKVDVRLESTFNDRATYNAGSAVNFTYTPYGSVSKTVHFILDGEELTPIITTASGTLQSYSIPAQSHGAHLLECYLTATINGSVVETEHIYKDIIWYDSSSDIPVIGCIYRCLPVAQNAVYDDDIDYYYVDDGLYVLYEDGSEGWASRPQLYYSVVRANQYDSTSMEYVVYNPNTGTPTVVQSIDGVDTTTTMNTYYDTLTYKTSEAGIHTIKLTCGITSIGIIMDIKELDIDVSPITANLAFDFNPIGYSNSSANRLWVDENDSSIAMSVSNNFDWSNGGYQLDNNGNQYFCIKAGTTATFSYNLFGTNPYTTGSHFKLIFKTDNIRNINTTWMSCLADSVGLEMKAHQANFKTSAETLEAPYSEGDITSWHFYAIGNIGDSKKTDKTRANDPNDVKEFTNEILDNTLANSIFDTGVVNLIVESLPTTGDLFTDYYLENGDGTYTLKRYLNNTWVTVNENVAKIENGAVAIVSSLPDTGIINIEYYISDNDSYTMFTWNGTAFSSGTVRAEIINSHMANSINPLQWVPGNIKYDSLYADESDGKFGNNTYEFRYEHKNVTETQHLTNMQIWRDMYEWVITSTDQEFVNELEDWFIKDAVLYYYLFTERYTMTDNRAKNSFWHWSKVYISETEATSDYAEVAEYYTIDNAAAAIHNGYRFDFWDYDNDTGLGINNSGEMKMPYGKEDIDYQVDNTPSSGYIFNGAESVFFRRVRLLLHSDLVSMYQDRESAGAWTSSTFISEFDDWQDEFPEELWRLDIERKYYRPYYGTAVDNSIAKSSDRFLKTMMNGRKKYHRRQFERDQAIYMGSKYLASAIRTDQIMFRCNTPQSAVVTPDYTLEIIPYSDMYLSVMFGNTTPYQVRAKAGKTYRVECPLQTMDDTAILIYAASRIQALNDLSACYIHDNDFSNATKLQTLVIGNTTSGYDNVFLTTLTLGNNALLATLDVRNCSNLTGSLNLSSCTNLATLRAEGTSLTGVIFANNGKVSTVYLPDTITSLTMRNLKNLSTINASLDNLESLILENGVLDSLSLIQDTYDTLQTLRLVGVDWTLSDTTLLNSILNMNSSYLAGDVYVSGQIRNQELLNYSNAWHDLEVSYDSSNLVTQYLATYVNDDGTILYEYWVDRGSIPPNPVTLGYINTPTKSSTDQYTFTFSGWDDIESVMLTARTITAQYTSTVRTYTVNWYSRPGLLLDTTQAEYGSEVVYDGAIPTNTTEESTYIYNLFAGWDKSTGYIRGNTDVYAIWERAPLPEANTSLEDMSVGQIFAVTTSGQTSNYFSQKDYTDIQLGHDFDFSNVESRVLAQDLYFDGSTATNTNITLFGENSPSFTLAVDFRFTDVSNTNNTLISCFEEDGTEGFRLRYNSNPNIQWGDKNANVGYSKYRDIVVLRHIKGENKLYVYSSNGSSSGFRSSVYKTELTRTRSTNTEQILTLGAIRFITDGGYDDYGSGYIYWAKIWFDDLGDENASKLAAWSHETIRAEFCGTGRYRLAGGTSQRTNASFISNALLLDRSQAMNSTSTNVGGWDECAMRTFMNNRLPDALPITWANMLKKVKISATAGNKSTEIIVSEDYFYLPCYNEMSGANTATYVSEGDHITWFTSDIRRAKFRMIIPDDASYYTQASDPSTFTGVEVKSGDVWKLSNNSTCYIYATDSDIRYYGLSTSSAVAASVGGYWISAISWWERSPNLGGTGGFWNVYTNGTNNYHAANATYGVCPCFSI